MVAGASGSLSSASWTWSAALALSTLVRWLVRAGGTWSTMATGRAKSAGSAGKMAPSASSAPADPPITMAANLPNVMTSSDELVDALFRREIDEGVGVGGETKGL